MSNNNNNNTMIEVNVIGLGWCSYKNHGRMKKHIVYCKQDIWKIKGDKSAKVENDYDEMEYAETDDEYDWEGIESESDTESEYDSDDDWDEVYGKDDVDNYVELIMAGGGSHAWSYIINKETEKYYIKHYDEDLDLMRGKTLLWRQEQGGSSQYVKEINKTDEIPEDNDEWFYFQPEY